jgi:phage/plasmid-associated DNA primase
VTSIPFTNAIPEDKRDPTLKQRFKEDSQIRSAILAWAVQGAIEWQQYGLQVP